MDDCKYSEVCKFYGTVDCYSDGNEEQGCFRHRYFQNNLNDRVIEAELMAKDRRDLE